MSGICSEHQNHQTGCVRCEALPFILSPALVEHINSELPYIPPNEVRTVVSAIVGWLSDPAHADDARSFAAAFMDGPWQLTEDEDEEDCWRFVYENPEDADERAFFAYKVRETP